MAIPDAALAEFWLRHVSYYRLSAYWLYFELPKGTAGPRFRPGTRFDDVTALYDFDRGLRRLVMRGTEHVEVALRGSWAYALAHSGGSHAYLRQSLYRDRHEFKSSRTKLQQAVARSSETYIDHYRRTYTSPRLPPVWMVAEMMSFGQLSRWYSNIADRSLRNRIAAPLGLHETVLVPLVRHLTDVRNICAARAALESRLSPAAEARQKADRSQSIARSARDPSAGQALQQLDNHRPYYPNRCSCISVGERFDRPLACAPQWGSRFDGLPIRLASAAAVAVILRGRLCAALRAQQTTR